MRRVIWILIFLQAWSARADLETDLKKTVASYRIPQERLGIYIAEVSKSGSIGILSVNSEKNFIPASLSKLVTASAILRKLGPSTKFETDLLGDWKGGDKLDGPLYLRGGGDPAFVSETMWLLVNEFYRNGIRTVGDLVVDESLFDDVRFDESRDPERNDRAYDAPVGAMSFNWNAINIYIRPGAVGGPVQVFLDPEMQGWKVVNHAKTAKSGSTDIRVSREGSSIIVEGKMPDSAPEKVVYKDVTDPALWSGEALRSFLGQRGITVTGKVRTGTTPASAKVLAKIDGQPVSTLLIDMMKFSNNFIAETLTKDLAVVAGKRPAHLEDGVKEIREALIESGVKADQFTFVNPSGLSRKNSLRPADLVRLLADNLKRFNSAPEYLTALPLAGIDGTLKKRFKKGDVAGWIRAKTGHLSGVAGLAGYAGQRDGGVRVFAFIFNGPEEQGDLARRLFDALASELVQ